MNNDDYLKRELIELKKRIEDMGSELRYLSSLMQCAQEQGGPELFSVLKDEVRKKSQSRLDATMAKRCDMRPECRRRFMGLLDENLQLLDNARISEEDIESNLGKLGALRANAVPGRCDVCFKEVDSLIEDQTRLMRQLRLYRTKEEIRDSIDDMPEDAVVRDLLEPLANPQRISIMKALSSSQRSFSELSEITKLRGGNLLFHLQRLTRTGMILQKGDRGDYMLSHKGRRSLEVVNDLYFRMGENEGRSEDQGHHRNVGQSPRAE